MLEVGEGRSSRAGCAACRGVVALFEAFRAVVWSAGVECVERWLKKDAYEHDAAVVRSRCGWSGLVRSCWDGAVGLVAFVVGSCAGNGRIAEESDVWRGNLRIFWRWGFPSPDRGGKVDVRVGGGVGARRL